ncbi:MAG: acyl-CoA carboxylase subunit epsilon [Pseudonocardiaceae bacterium]
MRGKPSDEEIAALTAAVVNVAGTRSARARSSASNQRSAWAEPAPRLRTPLHPGPSAWRASALPH